MARRSAASRDKVAINNGTSEIVDSLAPPNGHEKPVVYDVGSAVGIVPGPWNLGEGSDSASLWDGLISLYGQLNKI